MESEIIKSKLLYYNDIYEVIGVTPVFGGYNEVNIQGSDFVVVDTSFVDNFTFQTFLERITLVDTLIYQDYLFYVYKRG
jgi:hypothetical protein